MHVLLIEDDRLVASGIVAGLRLLALTVDHVDSAAQARAVFPNRGHGFGNEPYMVRRRWDYFVKHLLGAEPPPYEIKGPPVVPPATP